ncbi:telomere zinc finger-associated protein-like isoform X2 [Pararge aegeria]|nr:telomere zinc finger-associated protein-like isoform X2 [Pararge aegeria]
MNPCEHPIVILKDVAHQELRQLLQFMYRGEVHVRQQELSAFLHTAELLQVKGLTGGRERSESPPAPVEEDSTNAPMPPEPIGDSLPEWVPSGEETVAPEAPQESASSLVPKDEAARSPLKRLLKNTTNKNSYNIKKKPRPVSDNSPSLAENTEYASDGELMIDFDNDMLHNLVSADSAKESGWNCKTGGVKCPSCHRFFANRYNLKVHIRDKHDTREGTLQCDICQKRMRNPSCLRVHMYHHRKQAAYLAQLSAQGDQMRHVVQNMVGNKWRSDANADLRDVDNYPASGPMESKYQPAADAQLPVVPEAALPKVEATLETA